MKSIINANIVMPDHLITKGTVIINDGRIVDYGRMISTNGMEVYDAEGAYLGPGLIDIHTHSDGNIFFWDDLVKAANVLLSHGGQQYHNTDTPTHIKGWSYENKARNYTVHDNIFDRAAYRMLHLVAKEQENCPQMYNNTYIQYYEKWSVSTAEMSKKNLTYSC